MKMGISMGGANLSGSVGTYEYSNYKVMNNDKSKDNYNHGNMQNKIRLNMGSDNTG